MDGLFVVALLFSFAACVAIAVYARNPVVRTLGSLVLLLAALGLTGAAIGCFWVIFKAKGEMNSWFMMFPGLILGFFAYIAWKFWFFIGEGRKIKEASAVNFPEPKRDEQTMKTSGLRAEIAAAEARLETPGMAAEEVLPLLREIEQKKSMLNALHEQERKNPDAVIAKEISDLETK